MIMYSHVHQIQNNSKKQGHNRTKKSGKWGKAAIIIIPFNICKNLQQINGTPYNMIVYLTIINLNMTG